MSGSRRSVASALLFLVAAALAGLTLLPDGVAYTTFGMVGGLLAILLTYLFLLRGVWSPAPGALRWLPLVYGTAATAQLLTLLLPPPGVVQWVVVTGLAFTLWGAFATRTRANLMLGLGTIGVLLALLKFSVIPFLWERSGPGPGEAWGLGDLAEGFRRLFVEFVPLRSGGELPGFLAIVCWVLATRLLWPAEDRVELLPATSIAVGEPAPRLAGEERLRLPAD